MILVGNQRGNSRDMANHLLKSENEKVVIHEISGFMGRDLHSAFQESYAISRATKCSQHLYSLSLNPPKDADASDEMFENAIARAEQRLGLNGQPRAIVFHEKRGRDNVLRRHCHVVWCRIDIENMRAIHHSYDHRTLEKLSHELFLEHGWEVPRGFENKKERSKLNYTHAEHQQARRRGKYADDIKRVFQDAWSQSDDKVAFANALREKGYILARGDYAAVVGVDGNGEAYSVPRTLGLKTKEVRSRLDDLEDLPFAEDAKLLAKELAKHQEQDQRETAQRVDIGEAQNTASNPELRKSENPLSKRIERDPLHLLEVMTEREAVFTRHDIAKALSTHIEDPDKYQSAYAQIISSKDLVSLTHETDRQNVKARYSTREFVELERKLMDEARTMSQSHGFYMPSRHIERAISRTGDQLKREANVHLSLEQKHAIRHLTSDEQLCSVVGVAGAGKSTILNAAREAWEANGHRVLGAALAGKAAKGLEQSSGIKSRTLASYELSWQNGLNELQRGDVFVIDEAGMIGSRQMAKFVSEAKDKGVKLVLVGDAEQLQPINAGAPFRSITEDIKPATLGDVHRQKEDWQKQASKKLALGRTGEALRAYADHGRVEFQPTSDDAIEALASDYLNDFWSSRGQVSQLALAHRKADVKAINQTIRKARKEAGELENGHTFKTTHGRREFTAGDRILFTRNDRDVGVQNGMLGTVVISERGHLSVELDDKLDGNAVVKSFNPEHYADFDHGYATTIHKSQGATVDRSYVLASKTMDRHLTYVAMTRHRQEAKLYTGHEEFDDFRGLGTALSRKRHKQSTRDLMRSEGQRLAQRRAYTANHIVEDTQNYKNDSTVIVGRQEKNQHSENQSSLVDIRKEELVERLRQNRNQGPKRER